MINFLYGVDNSYYVLLANIIEALTQSNSKWNVR